MQSGILPPKKRWLAMAATQPSTTQSQQQTKKERSDSDMDISSDEEAAPAQPTIIITSHLFAPVVSMQEKNPLRMALEQHFALMSEGSIKPYHFSLVLKDIALYHRLQRKTLKKEQTDILWMTLFLYEKAVAIEPKNEQATTELESYKAHVMPHSNTKHAQDRNTRYKTECQKEGTQAFFWQSIDKYITRLKNNYSPDDFNQQLIALCEFLNQSASFAYMRNKHIPAEQHASAIQAFTDAAKQLHSTSNIFSVTS